jgi:glycosyltransferase involved in cell wall biosynthesis
MTHVFRDMSTYFNIEPQEPATRREPQTEKQSSSRATVLISGPSVEQLGGMASVITQTLNLDYGERFLARFLANTQAPQHRESLFAKIRRHAGHVLTLRRTIIKSHAKLIHIHTCSGFSFYRSALDMLVAQRLHRPVVLHIHGAAFDEFYRDSNAVGRRMIRWGLSRADTVLALSDQWRDRLLRISPKAKVVIVENAVDLPPSPSPHLANGKCRFALLAKMDTWKGIDDLLDACTTFSTREQEMIEITLAGPAGSAGNEKTILQKIADRDLKSVVRYVGPVRGEEKATLLRQADAYVQPSHNEGMPISVLEAFSYGLPVVGTTVGAMPEIVGATETGTLVPPRRPKELAAALIAIAGDQQRREMLGKNARALAETRFGLSRLRNDVVRVYDQLLRKSY